MRIISGKGRWSIQVIVLEILRRRALIYEGRGQRAASLKKHVVAQRSTLAGYGKSEFQVIHCRKGPFHLNKQAFGLLPRTARSNPGSSAADSARKQESPPFKSLQTHGE